MLLVSASPTPLETGLAMQSWLHWNLLCKLKTQEIIWLYHPSVIARLAMCAVFLVQSKNIMPLRYT